MDLHSQLIGNEVLVGGKGDSPSGVFKAWLESAEGQRSLSRGMEIEKEHTKDTKIAREIATDHLKEDRKYYQKLAKAGLDESMGVGGPGAVDPNPAAGSGVVINGVVPVDKRKRKPLSAKKLTLGSPATSGMVGVNPMVPGRSAFAKAIETFIQGGQPVTEMFIEGKRNLRDGSGVLAYRSKIWIIPPGSSHDAEFSKRMLASIKREILPRKQDTYYKDLNALIEERPDILFATYRKYGNKSALEIHSNANDMQPNLNTSVLVKKVAQALGVSTVTNLNKHGEVVYDADTEDLKPKAPTWGYHGTSTRWLMSILEHGIAPKPNQTNFDNIKHRDTIFLTLGQDKAVFHATNAVPVKTSGGRSGERMHKTNGMGQHLWQPVVFQVRVPDPNLIVADYDIDREGPQTTHSGMYDANHDRVSQDKGKLPGNPTKISKSIGAFGYRGRILPQHIVSVFIGPKQEAGSYDDDLKLDDFRQFKPAHVRKWMKELLDLYSGEDEMLHELDLADYLNNPEYFIESEKEARGENDDA